MREQPSPRMGIGLFAPFYKRNGIWKPWMVEPFRMFV